MTISELKKKALETLKGNWGKTIGLTVLILLINAVAQSIVVSLTGGPSAYSNPDKTPPGADGVDSFFRLILVPLNIGVLWFYLSFVRNENPEVTDPFKVYKDFTKALKLIGANLLVGVFTILWTFLFIVPGIIKAIAYSQTFYLLKDHPEYTVTEAITESRKRMDGHKSQYFLLGLSFIGWGILSILTLGIGLLWLIPYTSTTMATFYNEVIAPQGKGTENTVTLTKE